MLELDVEHGRGPFRLRVQAALAPRVTGLFGRSGSGKTTLLHLIAGLARPDRGRILLDGQPLLDTARGIDLPAHRRHVGIVFQDARLFPHYSVEGNLRYGQQRRSGIRHGPQCDFDTVVSLLELRPLLHRRPRQLSGGEQQRVALGRALLSSPRLLLLDEPLSSLDAALKRQILPFLQRVRDRLELPMIYVSHELGEMLQITDRLLMLEQGQVLGCGLFLDLAQTQDVLRSFHELDLLNVLTARVQAHEAGSSVLALGPAAAPLRAPITTAAVGETLSMALRPEDIALSLAPLAGISIQNQLPGRVVRLAAQRDKVVARIDVGVELLVEITPRAVAELSLAQGHEVVCLIKASALRYL